MVHLLGGSVGFACLIGAGFVLARGDARRGQRPMAVASRVMGVLFTVSFAGIASGASNSAIKLAFTAAVILSYAWLTIVAVDLYRRTRIPVGAR